MTRQLAGGQDEERLTADEDVRVVGVVVHLLQLQVGGGEVAAGGCPLPAAGRRARAANTRALPPSEIEKVYIKRRGMAKCIKCIKYSAFSCWGGGGGAGRIFEKGQKSRKFSKSIGKVDQKGNIIILK
jgi:hypothetical protein